MCRKKAAVTLLLFLLFFPKQAHWYGSTGGSPETQHMLKLLRINTIYLKNLEIYAII